ncbi:MAG: substrate-binding domain-containing protein, partial [Anaerolineae bacterium]
MNSKRYLVALSLLLIVSMLAAACGAAEPTAEPAQATDQPAEPAAGAKKIGFSVYDMQYGFFQDMEAGTREAAEAAGYEYTLVDQKSSESTMVASTMDLLNQGIDALIISPFKPDAMGPIVDAAKEKG